ncbi:hypothetical protein XA68_17742 [Ophiocordyceps unilateralis]|uniref:Uncharacterized protein n=1 Tax=Ophiocordyceps unilateralis TaxID=268505 RepID=A0A2A9P2P7_OPHUN|nr:hypothetical protein XA68_17742 [Ophiocordyceps unilateralis]
MKFTLFFLSIGIAAAIPMPNLLFSRAPALPSNEPTAADDFLAGTLPGINPSTGTFGSVLGGGSGGAIGRLFGGSKGGKAGRAGVPGATEGNPGFQMDNRDLQPGFPKASKPSVGKPSAPACRKKRSLRE